MLFTILFVKCSNNFFSIKIINNICPWHTSFVFFNHKNFFRLIWIITFYRSIFIFLYSNIISFKFRIFILNFFTRVNICASFYINRLHVNCYMYYYIYILTISCTLSKQTFIETEVCIYNFVFKVLISLSATTDFHLLSVEYISIAFFCKNDLIDLL